MYNGQLKFNEHGKFRIAVFTDIHEKVHLDNDLSIRKSADTRLFMETALDALKPDLVVLCGDICLGFRGDDVETVFMPGFRGITEPMIQRNIPFASVLGNHEHDMPFEKLKNVLKVYENAPLSLAKNQNGSEHGLLDYSVSVLSSDGKKDALNLWFMDSNNLVECEDGSVYDGVRRDQIEWYEKTADEISRKNGGTVPAVLFEHIPVQEMYNIFKKPCLFELPVSVKGYGFLNGHRFAKSQGCEGYLGEGPCCSYYNDGQFASWKRKGDVFAAFFGHDHLNDVHGEFDGIIMGQCKTGGFNCYTDGCRTGTRVIDIDENDVKNIKTYMVHFKQLGLKSSSLGPIMKRINDRQSMAMHAAAKYAGIPAACAAAVFGAYRIIKK
ncbi:MAG: metallophosphoesterase family protein [Clostridia bacterium]|nr:metallophosphoesterase family protein [Clostridia bacterium]